jgi:hypothetical protein
VACLVNWRSETVPWQDCVVCFSVGGQTCHKNEKLDERNDGAVEYGTPSFFLNSRDSRDYSTAPPSSTWIP